MKNCVNIYWKLKLWWIQYFCMLKDEGAKLQTLHFNNCWDKHCEEKEDGYLCSKPQFEIIVFIIDSLLLCHIHSMWHA